MFDFTWGETGITIYWPNSGGTTYPPGTYPPGTYPTTYQQGTQISNGMLILIGVGLYLLLRK